MSYNSIYSIQSTDERLKMIANSKTRTILPIVLTMVLSIGVFGCSGDSTNLESNENYVADTIAYVTPTGWEESDLLEDGHTILITNPKDEESYIGIFVFDSDSDEITASHSIKEFKKNITWPSDEKGCVSISKKIEIRTIDAKNAFFAQENYIKDSNQNDVFFYQDFEVDLGDKYLMLSLESCKNQDKEVFESFVNSINIK